MRFVGLCIGRIKIFNFCLSSEKIRWGVIFYSFAEKIDFEVEKIILKNHFKEGKLGEREFLGPFMPKRDLIDEI